MASIKDSKCVLVTGATSGIGRALAQSIARLPGKPCVIAAGRRQERLDELAKEGLETVQLDVEASHDALKKFVEEIVLKYPNLDSIILCAGVQHEFDFKGEVDLSKIVSEMNINYTSVVALISLFLPHFLNLGAQGRKCSIIPVTSGLAIVPAPWVLNYSASKAALHSFSVSLRAQLKNTNVHVMEIIPPLVESELHDAYGTTEKLSKFWMPLEEYITKTMEGLEKGDINICTGNILGVFENFEKGKDELAEQFQKRREEW